MARKPARLNLVVTPQAPRFRYRLIRKGRGHGYVAIYKIVDSTVEVIHYYHTAQDWQGKLMRGE